MLHGQVKTIKDEVDGVSENGAKLSVAVRQIEVTVNQKLSDFYGYDIQTCWRGNT